MIDGKFEVQKDSNNMLIMIGMEDGRLLKLNGTCSHTHNVAYLSDHGKRIMAYSILWHAIFFHINYGNLHLLKNNGISSLPTNPRKLKQCDVCILGNHRKQPFHEFISISCRNRELIHFDLCDHIPIPSKNGNKYIISFIDDYTRMCWVYLLKDKSQAFKTFKNFHAWIQNEAQSCIGMTQLYV